MAKSIRSKIKKRLRTAKRQRVDAMIRKPQESQKHDALQRVIQGRVLITRKPKNAFKYPDAPDAVFEQHEVQKPIDFRAQNLPMAGYAFRGNRRKYDGEEAEYMKMLASSSHPKMEVMAGGGAILAATGQRISVRESELLAAAVQIGAAAGGPAIAPPAVENSMKVENNVTIEPAGDGPPDGGVKPGGDGGAAAASAASNGTPAGQEHLPATDHSRRPLVRDTRRAERVSARRPRSIATKKKGKQQVERAGGSAVPDGADVTPKKPSAGEGDADDQDSAGGVSATSATVAPAPMQVDTPPQQGQDQGVSPAASKGRRRKSK